MQPLKFNSHKVTTNGLRADYTELLVKVEKRYCGIRKGLTEVIIFYHATCSYVVSGLSLQVDRIFSL